MRLLRPLPSGILGILFIFSTAHCGRVRLELVPDPEEAAGDTGFSGGNGVAGSAAGGGGISGDSGGGSGGDVDCTFDKKCDGACRECGLDRDCPSRSPHCICGRCVACRSDPECGDASLICQHETGRCVRTCGGGHECHGFCETGICIDCKDDSHCRDPNSRKCSPVTLRCVECLSNFDCDDHAPCVEGRCGCFSDRDCPDGKHCDVGDCRR